MDEREAGRLLQRGRTAAFRGRPAAGVEPLKRVLASAEPGSVVAAEAGWLSAVVLTALGRYGAALGRLDALDTAAGGSGATASDGRTGAVVGPSAGRTAFPALAAATRGAAYRQLGRHGEGEVADRAAVALAAPAAADVLPDARIGLAERAAALDALADARIGLVADAVGQGQVDAATDRLAAAAAAAACAPDPRHSIRLAWVRAEVGLLTGRAAEAAAYGREALAAARRAGYPRHVTKSLLFLGVAEREAGDPTGREHLTAAADTADVLGLLPLAWPAHAVLGDLAAARSAVSAIGEELPAEMAAAWFAAPDRAAVLADSL